jgi:periplasmic protein TonB
MDYAQQQRSPTKHLTGFVVVVLLHVLMGYALVSGLARQVVEKITAPLDTKIIEEIKPPPPEKIIPPPPKIVPVLPTFVPPPEVQIQAPITPPTITSPVTNTPPPVFTPPAPPAPVIAAPPAPPAPAVVSAGVACPNSRTLQADIKYPPQARKDGLDGDVLIEFTLTASGEVKDIEVKSSSNRVFNNVSIATVRQFSCTAQGRDVRVQAPFSFKLGD